MAPEARARDRESPSAGRHSRENPGKTKGDLWDSVRIRSIRRVVAYSAAAGRGSPAWWKVRVWDQAGQDALERPGALVDGVLRDSEWSAAGSPGACADVKEGTPLPCPWLRKTFTLAKKPQRATAYVNALGYYELYVNGKKSTTTF